MSALNFSLIFKWFIRLLYTLLLIILGLYLLRNVNEIKGYDFNLDLHMLTVCIATVTLSYLLNALLWNKFAAIYAVHTDFLHSSKAWFQSQLGKYIPGKVSLILFRVNAYPQPLRAKVALASLYEYIANQAASCLIIFIALTLAPHVLPPYMRIFALIGIASFFVMLMPALFVPVVNRIFNVIRHPPLDSAPSYRNMLIFVGIYVISLLLQSVGFYFVLAALTTLDISRALTAAGIYQAASLMGIFAFFAPAGLGVREGVMLLGLSWLMIPEPVAIVAVVLMRLVTVAVELSFACLFIMLPAKRHSAANISNLS